MRKTMLAIVLAAAVVCGSVSAYAQTVARTISIHSIEGSDVTVTKGSPESFKAKKGMKLYDGYTLSTGKKSTATLKLDDDSSIKVDKESSISISKTSGNKLSISVLSGAVAVNATPQKKNQTLEVRAGNSALAVRGTTFSVELDGGGRVEITMLSGSGDVDGTLLTAGRVMTITDGTTGEQKSYDISDISLSNLSPFVLETILGNKAELTELGIFSQQEIDTAQNRLDEIQRADAGTQAPLGGGSSSSSNNSGSGSQPISLTAIGTSTDNPVEKTQITAIPEYTGTTGTITYQWYETSASISMLPGSDVIGTDLYSQWVLVQSGGNTFAPPTSSINNQLMVTATANGVTVHHILEGRVLSHQTAWNISHDELVAELSVEAATALASYTVIYNASVSHSESVNDYGSASDPAGVALQNNYYNASVSEAYDLYSRASLRYSIEASVQYQAP